MPGKKKPAAKNGNETGKVEEVQRRPRGYLVRFPDPEAEQRAVMILGEVGLPYSGFPDEEYGVRYGLLNRHIEALEREQIPFEVVS